MQPNRFAHSLRLLPGIGGTPALKSWRLFSPTPVHPRKRVPWTCHDALPCFPAGQGIAPSAIVNRMTAQLIRVQAGREIPGPIQQMDPLAGRHFSALVRATPQEASRSESVRSVRKPPLAKSTGPQNVMRWLCKAAPCRWSLVVGGMCNGPPGGERRNRHGTYEKTNRSSWSRPASAVMGADRR